MRYDFGELIFGGAYTWRGLFSEFYGILSVFEMSDSLETIYLTTVVKGKALKFVAS